MARAKKPTGTPPLALRLDLFVSVYGELAELTASESDPVRANKMRGIVRRFAVALDVNQIHGIEFPRQRMTATAKLPRGEKEMTTLITEAMSEGKKSGQTFKEFLRRWETDPVGGLRLKQDAATGKYTVTDENGTAKERTFTEGSLSVRYSKTK